MTDESLESDMKTYPPWIVYDPDTKAEFVTAKTLRYYVAHVKEEWFICDRFTDRVIPETISNARAEAIRKFYKLNDRPIPEGWRIPSAVNGTEHTGI
jgi:hypothetical protein